MRAMLPRFDVLILDLDGTLVDSAALLVNLVNDTLVGQGYPPAEAQTVGACIGLPLEDVFRRAAPPGEPGDMIQDLCTRYRILADAPEFVRQFRLYPGVAPTLETLRAAGSRLVVATSKRRATTMDILRHCGIDELMEAVIGGDCVTRGKPHPEMVYRARRLCPASPDRTLIVGDTSFDIEMGQAAGIATCAITYGVHPAHTLRALRPDFVIDRFDALRHVLNDSAADR